MVPKGMLVDSSILTFGVLIGFLLSLELIQGKELKVQGLKEE